MLVRLLLTFFLFSSFVYANDLIIDSQEFVNMDRKSQAAVIKNVHNFLTEFEFQRELHEGHISITEQKKYVHLKKLFFNFINEAHAEDIPSEIANDLCYYGGWMSLKVKTRSGPKCIHPRNLATKKDGSFEIPNMNRYLNRGSSQYDYFAKYLYPKYKKLYYNKQDKAYLVSYNPNSKTFELANQEANCSAPDNIVCNPEIYGQISGKPFCVSGNQSHGLNSSYMCSKALDILQERDDQSSYEAALKSIVDQVSNENKNSFLYTLKTMYDTCLCGAPESLRKKAGVDKNYFGNTIDQSYANRIFNTRTCEGILNQTRHIANAIKSDAKACSQLENKSVIDSGELKWSDLIIKAESIVQKEVSEANQKTLNHLSPKLSVAQKNAAFKEDNANLSLLRMETFNQAVEQKICLISPKLPKKPQVIEVENLEKVEIAASLEARLEDDKIRVIPTGITKAELDKLKPVLISKDEKENKPYQLEEIEYPDQNFYLFNIKPGDSVTDVSFKAINKKTNEPLESNKVKLTPPNKSVCSYSFDTKNKKLKVTPQLADGEELQKYLIDGKEMDEATSDKAPSSVSLKTNKGEVTCSKKENEEDAPAPSSDLSCSIKIINNSNDSIVALDSEITINGKKIDDDSKEHQIELIWYNLSVEKTEEKEEVEEGMLSDNETLESNSETDKEKKKVKGDKKSTRNSDDEEDDSKSKDKEETEDSYKDKFNKLFLGEGENEGLARKFSGLPKAKTKQVYGLELKVNDGVCRAQDKVEISPLGQKEVFNTSPVRLKGISGGAKKVRGTIYGGQR